MHQMTKISNKRIVVVAMITIDNKRKPETLGPSRDCRIGVQRKIMRKSASGSTSICPVAAAHPITGGSAPAAPPMTMFWDVARFSHAVYTTT